MSQFAYVKVRGQLIGVSSFLPSAIWILWIWTVKLGGLCFYPLSHLIGPVCHTFLFYVYKYFACNMFVYYVGAWCPLTLRESVISWSWS